MAGGMYVVSGQEANAIPLFEKALEVQPDHPETLFELGNIRLANQEAETALRLFTESVASLDRAVAAGTEGVDTSLLPTALSNLGNTLNDLGRPKEALAAFERAASTKPPKCIAFNGLSNAYEGMNRYDDARKASARGTKLLPDCDYAYYNLGRLLRAAERSKEAQAAFRSASALKPDSALYANGLGTALHANGQPDPAIEAYKTAIQLDPKWSAPYRNIGLVHYESGGRAKEALYWYEQTIKLEPTSAETYCDMGTAYLELHDQARSMVEYERALSLEPSNALARANVVYLSTKHCRWMGGEERHDHLRALWDDLLDRINAKRRNPMMPSPHLFLPPYHALAYDRSDPIKLRELAAAYAEHAADRAGATASPPPPHPPPPNVHWRKSADTRLTVGYLTTDFGNHPTTHLMQSVFRIQQELGSVRAICFARSDDRSEQRRRLMKECEEFVDLTGLDWRVSASEIRKRRIPLLVDLNGHCGKPQFEILSLRPAPVQISYMGHPGTSGAEYVQYVLTDRSSAPVSGRTHFSEHLVSLHQWHVTDYRFAHNFETLAPPPSVGRKHESGPTLKWPHDARREDIDLPSSGFIFATFNQLYKVSPLFYASWLNTLKRSPSSSRLWMLHFPDIAASNLQAEAIASGVRSSRLIGAPTVDRTFHLARTSLADLHLDTSPYNGHTTVGDTTWMGTPSLTLPGGMMQSRVAVGYAINAGCPYLSAHSLKWYEDMATDLARRPHAIARVRKCLHEQRWTAAAFDTRKWVAAFDEGAKAMWEISRYGKKPMHVLLPARHVAGVG